MVIVIHVSHELTPEENIFSICFQGFSSVLFSIVVSYVQISGKILDKDSDLNGDWLGMLYFVEEPMRDTYS